MAGKKARQVQVAQSRRNRRWVRRMREALAPYEPPVPCPLCDGHGKPGGCNLCGVRS